jgi:hypothetical protein
MSVKFEASYDGADRAHLTDFERVITDAESWFFLYHLRDSVSWCRVMTVLIDSNKKSQREVVDLVLWSVKGVPILLMFRMG